MPFLSTISTDEGTSFSRNFLDKDKEEDLGTRLHEWIYFLLAHNSIRRMVKNKHQISSPDGELSSRISSVLLSPGALATLSAHPTRCLYKQTRSHQTSPAVLTRRSIGPPPKAETEPKTRARTLHTMIRHQ